LRNAEEGLIRTIRECGVDTILFLPCDRIRSLLARMEKDFFYLPLTREEEGVGIAAGMALAGRRPAMLVQSSGIGNMINALLSLTGFYELPLAIFVSHRGVYREKIAAQVPMGRRLAGILRGAGVSHSVIRTQKDMEVIRKRLPLLYNRGRMHAFLLSPAIFEGKCRNGVDTGAACSRVRGIRVVPRCVKPRYTRFSILELIAPYIKDKAVVCNLGVPSKELYAVGHQSSNFYMLGSMGMATPIGLGISLSSDREVAVIDGDGSILMNPGSLATAAHFDPPNLTVVAIDNGSYGSTGGQRTLAGSCVDLSAVASGFGIKDVIRVAGKKGITDALRKKSPGMKFIHVLALPGNADVPNIPLHHLENKRQVMEFLGKTGGKG
jgi:sulfopyruvate decarboxylase subunit beta